MVTSWTGVVALGLLLGCTQRNASHCGNLSGDATCRAINEQTPYCDVCEAINDGCVSDPVADASCRYGPGSSGEDGTMASDTGTTAGTGTASSADGSSTGDDCGNGVVDPGEACDGDTIPAGTDCAGEGFGEGLPACRDDCTEVDYTVCPQFVGCGDGNIGMGEICDGRNVAGATCNTFPHRTDPGLMCNDECTDVDPSGCQMCAEITESCVEDDDCCDGLICRGLVKNCCIPGGLGCALATAPSLRSGPQ